MNFFSDVNVGNDSSSRDNGLLDLVNDPFFLGKASVLDHELLVKLKRYEVLFGERRAQLEQILGADCASVQGLMQISPLSTALADRAVSPPSEIVEQER